MQCAICTCDFHFTDALVFCKNEDLLFLSCGQYCCITCFKNAKSCPFCRQPKAGHVLTGNARTAINIFELSQAYECEYCMSTMTLQDLFRHAHTCTETIIICTCSMQIKRRELAKHHISQCVNFARMCRECCTSHALVDLCPAERQLCCHCDEQFTRQTMQSHMALHLACCNSDCDVVVFGMSAYFEHRTVCEYRAVKCEACFEEEIPLIYMAAHFLTCSQRIVTCAKCEVEVTFQTYMHTHESPSYCSWCLERGTFLCQLEKHQLSCQRRPMKCDTCFKIFAHSLLQKHVCPKAIIKCTLCMTNIARCDIKSHLKRECVYYVHQCQVSAICQFQYTKQETDKHQCPQSKGALILKPGAMVDYCDIFSNVWEVCKIIKITNIHYELSSKWYSTLYTTSHKIPLDEILNYVQNYRQVTKYGCYVGRTIFQKIDNMWQSCTVSCRQQYNFCQLQNDEKNNYDRTIDMTKSPLKVMGYFKLSDFTVGDMFLYGADKILVSIVSILTNSIVFRNERMMSQTFSLNFATCRKKGVLQTREQRNIKKQQPKIKMNEFQAMNTMIQDLHVLPNALINVVCHYAVKTGHQRLLAMLKTTGNTFKISDPKNRDSITLIYNDRTTVVMQIRMYGIDAPIHTLPTTKLAIMLENKSWLKSANTLWMILHEQWLQFKV